MIDDYKNFIFIHIPKNGGTSIESSFIPDAIDRDKYIYGKSHLQLDNKAHLKICHLKMEYPSLNFDEYFKFTFVRNPWSRVVSSFFHTQKIHRGDLRSFLSLSDKFTFKEFVVSLKNSEKPHPHYDDQFSFIINSNQQQCLDYIGRLETFQHDFDIICKKIGIPAQRLPHVNKTKHTHYTEYYDNETKQIVAEKYAKDIEYFGYEFTST